MTRPLGSFNRLVNLTNRSDDWQQQPRPDVAKNPEAVLGYTLGLMRNRPEKGEYVPTNAEKFVSGRIRANTGSSKMRMAGIELRNQLPPL